MELAQALAAARDRLNPCQVCPWRCRVNRPAGQTGYCGTGGLAQVASVGAHFGEESVLVGQGGSGTMFFQGCNLKCVFCQNYNISSGVGAQEVTPGGLAGLMLDLQRESCSNINLVTPTHVAPQILEALAVARDAGLVLPVVYNCGGYELVETLELLSGWIDIYMPDFKYADPRAGRRYSGVKDYPQVAQAALAEMYRQVGPLKLDRTGLATRGVLVRHLVMPLNLAGSEQVIDLVAQIAPGCAINVMAQYQPCFRASEFPELLTKVPAQEIKRLRDCAARRGLVRVD